MYMTTIHNAVRSGNLALLRRIIASGANLNTRSGGLTPLHVAAESGQTNIARALINAGANTNARSSRSGMTSLHLAAARSRSNIIRALINAGANTEAKNTRGFKPIDFINNNRTRNLLRTYARTKAQKTILKYKNAAILRRRAAAAKALNNVRTPNGRPLPPNAIRLIMNMLKPRSLAKTLSKR